MPLMKAVQVGKPGGSFELVERPIPDPGRGQVRIKVEACGVCHSDVLVKDGLWPGLPYPRIPGHEIAGQVDAIGADVAGWKPGQRVGVGWHGGHFFTCDACRRGDFILCQFEKITAIAFDGGYAEYMVAPAEAVAALPEGLPADDAAPLLCAGVTMYNPCAIPAPGPATWWRSRGLEAWAISGSSAHAGWDSGPSPSGAEETRSLWRERWALTTISTPTRALRLKPSRSWEARA